MLLSRPKTSYLMIVRLMYMRSSTRDVKCGKGKRVEDRCRPRARCVSGHSSSVGVGEAHKSPMLAGCAAAGSSVTPSAGQPASWPAPTPPCSTSCASQSTANGCLRGGSSSTTSRARVPAFCLTRGDAACRQHRSCHAAAADIADATARPTATSPTGPHAARHRGFGASGRPWHLPPPSD